jgi:hypothetical protein
MSEFSRGDTRSDWQAEAGVRATRPGERPTGWAQYLVFAGVILAVVGLFQVMAGLTALFNDDVFAVRAGSLLVTVNYDVWGWFFLVLGVAAVVAGSLLLRGNLAGRLLAAIVAGVSILLHLAFLQAAPLWAAVTIAFNILVIYAVTAHGAELKSDR